MLTALRFYFRRCRKVLIVLAVMMLMFLSISIQSTNAAVQLDVVLVANFGTNSVLGFELQTGEPLGVFVNVNGPGGLVVNPLNNTLLVSSFNDNAVLVFDANANFLGYAATGLTNPRGLLMSNFFNGVAVVPMLLVASDNGVQGFAFNIATGAYAPFGQVGAGFGISATDVNESPIDGFVYIADQTSNAIYRLNPFNGAFVDGIGVPYGQASGISGLSSPRRMEFAPDGTLYVTSGNTGSVKRYFPNTGAYILPDYITGVPGATAMTIAGNELLISSFDQNIIYGFNIIMGGAPTRTFANASDGLNSPTDMVFWSTVLFVPPVTQDDTYTLNRNVQLDSAASGGSVLTNDTLWQNATITSVDTSGLQGTLSLNNATGNFTYIPARDFTGTETFTYALSNVDGTVNGTVTLQVDSNGAAVVDANTSSEVAPISDVFPNDTPVLSPEPVNNPVYVEQPQQPTPQPTPVPTPNRDEDRDDDDCNLSTADGISAAIGGRGGCPEVVHNFKGNRGGGEPMKPQRIIPIFEDSAILRTVDDYATSIVMLEQSNVEQSQTETVTYGNVFFRLLDPTSPNDLSMIGDQSVIDSGVIRAVDIFALEVGTNNSLFEFTQEYLVCMLGVGSIIELSSTNSPRTPEWATAGYLPGYTCTYVSSTGTLVLVNQINEIRRLPNGIVASSSSSTTANSNSYVELENCLVTPNNILNFRAGASSTSDVLGLIPFDYQVRAIGRQGDWYNVIYGDDNGYISTSYVTTAGHCRN